MNSDSTVREHSRKSGLARRENRLQAAYRDATAVCTECAPYLTYELKRGFGSARALRVTPGAGVLRVGHCSAMSLP